MTDRSAVLLAINTHATRAWAQPSSRADVGVFTHVSTQVLSLSLSLHVLAVDCPRNDYRFADGGTFMYLYVYVYLSSDRIQ